MSDEELLPETGPDPTDPTAERVYAQIDPADLPDSPPGDYNCEEGS